MNGGVSQFARVLAAADTQACSAYVRGLTNALAPRYGRDRAERLAQAHEDFTLDRAHSIASDEQKKQHRLEARQRFEARVRAIKREAGQ